MDAADRVLAGEIGDGAGDAEDPGIAAGRKLHRGGGLGEELTAGFVRRGENIERIAIELRICAGAPGVDCAAGLAGAGGGDAGGNLVRAFGRRRQYQIGGGDGRDLDMQVDAVEQRAGDLGLIIGGAAWRPRTGEGRIA